MESLSAHTGHIMPESGAERWKKVSSRYNKLLW